MNMQIENKNNRRKTIASGKLYGTSSPYGYVYDCVTGRLLQNPKQVEIVKCIGKLYEIGYGTSKIASKLNSERNVFLYGTTQNDFKWHESAVAAVATRPIYCGMQEYGGVLYHCSKVDAIFTEDEWLKINNIYTERNHKYPHKYFNDTLLFKGILTCCCCGDTMQLISKTNNYEQANGDKKKYVYRQYKCKCRKIDREDIEPLIVNAVDIAIKEYDSTELDKYIINTQETLDRYLEAYINAPVGSSLKDSLVEQFEIKKVKLSRLKKEREVALERMSHWKHTMTSPEINREIKRALAVALIDMLYIDNTNDIKVQLNITKIHESK